MNLVPRDLAAMRQAITTPMAAAVLRGERRPDLMRDETAGRYLQGDRARPAHAPRHDLRRPDAHLRRSRRRFRRDCARAAARGHRPRRRGRPLDAPRFRTAGRADRRRQVGRGLAALRCRRSGGAHRDLPGGRCRKRHPHVIGIRPARRSCRPDGVHLGGVDRRRRRVARRCARAWADAGSSGLPDLHVRLDRHAQGHRHQPPQHLPLPALRERGLRPHGRGRHVPERLGRVRSLDGGDLDSLSRRRDPVGGDA